MAASITRQVKATELILNSQNDWEDWYARHKARAIRAGIWIYMDDTTQDAPSSPAEPTPPSVTNACSRPAGTTTRSYVEPTMQNLTTEERAVLGLLNTKYSQDFTIYRTDKQRLLEATKDIPSSVSRSYNNLINNCISARVILTVLRQVIAPTQRSREVTIRRAWLAILTGPKASNIDSWLL